MSHKDVEVGVGVRSAARAGRWLLSGIGAMLLGMAPGVHAETQVRSSAFEYDAATGLVTKEIIEPGNSELCVAITYEYDSFGNRKKATSRNCNGSAGSSPGVNNEAAAPASGSKAIFTSRSSSTDYGSAGQFPLSSTNALNQSETKTYDARFGAVTSLTGPNGLTTKWAYDSLGRKVLEERADGNGTRWKYEYCSSVTVNGAAGTASCPTIAGAVGTYVVTATPVKSANATNNTDGGANGPYSKVYTDGLGRTIRTETQGFDGTPSGGTTTAKLIYQDTEYNARGLVARKSRPYFSDAAASSIAWAEYTYDTLGRVLQEKAPDGSLSKMEYAGLSTKATNAKNQNRTETKNEVGQVVSIVDALGYTLTRGYDALGNLVQTTDALGNVTKLEYDLKGRKTKMIDPDMGTWTYVYNAIGELVQQTDAKAQVTTLTYDLLGRLTAKQEPSLNANWYYDQYKDGSACTKGIGKLCEATANNGYVRRHTYDSLGRGVYTATIIDGTIYNSSTNYIDAPGTADHGRLKEVIYPTNTKLAYVYTPLGYVQKIVNGYDASSVYWRQDSADAEGHILQQTYGNNVVLNATFDAKTGQLKTQKAGNGSTAYVQDASYSYDSIGSLTSQGDAASGQSVTYGYDELNRLKNEVRLGTAVTTPTTLTWDYNEIGNITSRSDVGTYAYPASGAASVRPHAVSSVAGTVNGVLNPSYAYDSNGNITSTAGRTVTWTSFNKINTISRTAGANTTLVSLWYDAENERVKETVTQNGSLSKTVIYLNPGAGAGLFYEEETTAGNPTKKRHYITAGGTTVGVLVLTGSTWTTQYWHKDHLGSTVAVTDAVGAVTERMGYEPFGKRRNVDGSTDLLGSLAPVSTSRGYTGHEMMDEVGLVNMNGRVYDPAISRFLSADPYIQSPDNLQSYNRYSYGFNSPLNGTDPTGFNWASRWTRSLHKMSLYPSPSRVNNAIHNSPGQATIDHYILKNPWANQLGQTAATAFTYVFCGGCGGLIWQSYYTYQATGSVGASLRASAITIATQIAFYGVGSYFAADSSSAWVRFENAVGHAAVGCASEAASGGNCGQGAASAFAGAIGTNFVGSDFATATVFGGLGSMAAGGDFAKGASVAATGYLFNYLVHSAAEARSLFNSGATKGHHWIPFDSLKGLDISEDAMRYWGAAKSGATMAGDHMYDAAHIAYNEAVRVELEAYASKLNIDLSKMTTDQARSFTNHILSGASNSTIKGYVGRISASVASRAAMLGASQAGRIAGGLLRVIGSVGATLMFHTGDAN